MSSGHNRNGRGNQRRHNGSQRQQPQNGQPRNAQERQPRDERNASRPPTQAMSMTTSPARSEAPFQAPDTRSSSDEETVVIFERVTREITEVTLDVGVEPAPRQQNIPAPSRLPQQRNTQPPSKRGPLLVPSERHNGADNNGKSNSHANQHGQQHQANQRERAHVGSPQPDPAEPFVVAEPLALPGPPRFHHGERDAARPPEHVGNTTQQSGADDNDDDAGYGPRERRSSLEVRGDVGPLIDSLHDLFIRDRAIASQGNVTRCGICYLHYPLSELEYREVEGYYVCFSCKRSLGSTQLMMIRRQQKN